MGKILVTGAGGFIGRHLCEALHEAGADFYGHTHEEGDLSQLDYVRAFMKGHGPFDLVYHLAGVTAGAGVIVDDPFALAVPNLNIATSVLQASHEAGVKAVVFASSTTGYPDSDMEMTEDDYHGPLFPGYRTIGTVKRFVENWAAMYPTMTTVALRITNVFGPHDDFDPKTSHVIQAMIRKVAERRDPIIVWGDGQDVRDTLYVSDVVDALILAGGYARALRPASHVAFNIGRGAGDTINDILRLLIASRKNYSPTILHKLDRPGLLRKRSVSVERAKQELKWSPQVPVYEGLIETLDWLEGEL